jgi:hypothetical protein
MSPRDQEIFDLINIRMKRILTVAQSSLPESQFLAFRRIVLNEFGKSGLEKELARILAEKHHKER